MAERWRSIGSPLPHAVSFGAAWPLLTLVSVALVVLTLALPASAAPASADSPATPTAPANAASSPGTSAPAAPPAHFRAPRDHRPLYWGLIAGGFLLLCAAVGGNDRPQGDPKPGAARKPRGKAAPAAGPPGYKV